MFNKGIQKHLQIQVTKIEHTLIVLTYIYVQLEVSI